MTRRPLGAARNAAGTAHRAAVTARTAAARARSGLIHHPPSPRTVLAAGVQLVAVSYLTCVASLLFWSHAPNLIGWHPRVVLTGSMMPVIQPGDVGVIGPASVGPASLPRGRVILVKDETMPSGFYLHRVVRYDDQRRIITKGDANGSEDSPPVLAAQVMGQLRLVVPLVGRPVVWLQNDQYGYVAGIAAATWAALTVVTAAGAQPSRTRQLPAS